MNRESHENTMKVFLSFIILFSIFSMASFVSAISCGNGIVESGEVCDDGNTINYDGCGSSCKDLIECKYDLRCVCDGIFCFNSGAGCSNSNKIVNFYWNSQSLFSKSVSSCYSPNLGSKNSVVYNGYSYWLGSPGATLENFPIVSHDDYLSWRICREPVIAICTPSTEVCDEKDNDCDGLVDENLVQGLDQWGLCSSNNQICSNGVWIDNATNILPQEEICDSKDNDCDGQTDEGLDCSSQCSQNSDCSSFNSSIYCYGNDVYRDSFTFSCVSNACQANPFQRFLVQDCGENSSSSSNLYCSGNDIVRNVTNIARGCSVNSCFSNNQINVVFVETCATGCLNGVCDSCVPSVEICDTLDNDCDGLVDEGLNCGPVCNVTNSGNEICDGVDNDCDGSIDENLTRNAINILGKCSSNKEVCQVGSWFNQTTNYFPSVEICNLLDDNCNGLVDEGLTCNLVCNETNNGVEICDNLDNDCDGRIDEGNVCSDDSEDCANTRAPTDDLNVTETMDSVSTGDGEVLVLSSVNSTEVGKFSLNSYMDGIDGGLVFNMILFIAIVLLLLFLVLLARR